MIWTLPVCELATHSIRRFLEVLTLSHDLVNLAVLLAADKLLVLVGQLNLHTHLVLAAHHEGNLVDDRHGSLDCIIGAVDRKGQVVKADLRFGVRTDIR